MLQLTLAGDRAGPNNADLKVPNPCLMIWSCRLCLIHATMQSKTLPQWPPKMCGEEGRYVAKMDLKGIYQRRKMWSACMKVYKFAPNDFDGSRSKNLVFWTCNMMQFEKLFHPRNSGTRGSICVDLKLVLTALAWLAIRRWPVCACNTAQMQFLKAHLSWAKVFGPDAAKTTIYATYVRIGERGGERLLSLLHLRPVPGRIRWSQYRDILPNTGEGTSKERPTSGTSSCGEEPECPRCDIYSNRPWLIWGQSEYKIPAALDIFNYNTNGSRKDKIIDVCVVTIYIIDVRPNYNVSTYSYLCIVKKMWCVMRSKCQKCLCVHIARYFQYCEKFPQFNFQVLYHRCI